MPALKVINNVSVGPCKFFPISSKRQDVIYSAEEQNQIYASKKSMGLEGGIEDKIQEEMYIN